MSEDTEIFLEKVYTISLILVVCLLPFTYGATCYYSGYKEGIEFMKMEANKNGCGEYNQETGKWQWKNNKFIGEKND